MNEINVWRAIDEIAKQNNMSCCAMAKQCDLNSTVFNKSKRVDKNGKVRLPSLRTIYKIMSKFHLSPSDFFRMGIE